jgi:threonylcarbamoyladenosine tRNA methylthiotransferase MtaB
MKVSVLTLGCKANQAESTFIETSLQSNGCDIVGLNQNPKFCIINTCSVTAKSDYQSRQLIRRAQKAGASVIVTGCFSELNKDAVKTMEGVISVIDNNNKSSIINMISHKTSSNLFNYEKYPKSRLFLKVQDGCNNSCSYCLIPKARGRSRSIDIKEVIKQIAEAHNFNEVVLTGIHLGTYGYDLYPKVKISDLVESILLNTNIKRVRLSSLEINEIDGRITDLLKEDRVCKHLHIPLQSGDDSILKRMNRNYKSKEFLVAVNRILKVIPNISIGTDIIAGFPGEGDNEFENTRNFLEELPITYVHIFPFSPRPGTKASEMDNRPGSSVVKKKCALLRELGLKKKKEYMYKQVGKTLYTLIEDVYDDMSVIGITCNYLKVRASLIRPKPKDIVPLRISGVVNDELIGQRIEYL